MVGAVVFGIFVVAMIVLAFFVIRFANQLQKRGRRPGPPPPGEPPG